jgi:iron complex outermembrane receptor protein
MLLAAGVMPAAAQDLYRQTVVVTAATTPVELGSATHAVMVLSREEIAALPVYSVADAVRVLTSVDVRARGIRGVQSDFSVRGAGFGQMLVLVDGVRLNDPQSGHHNGDIPVPLDAVERIEVLHGPGSSFFGADAVGGTVNIITRRTAGSARGEVHGGSFSTGGGSGHASFARGALTQQLAGSFDRSGGFMYDRDFSASLLQAKTVIGPATTVSVSALRKEFGANNFYGGNAPSREWTNQLLLTATRRQSLRAAWAVDFDASYRTHGDRFVFDQVNPARSDNRHRTHTALGRAVASRTAGAAVIAIGLEGGGDWIRSSSLGDHQLSRVSGFGELRYQVARGAQLAASLRMDRYAEFGSSWNPSVSGGWWVGSHVRVRGSVGRAFRVPTFTERYYSDPANLARAEVQPEHTWAGEAGADVVLTHGWLLQGTLFTRADHDVIDWLRASPADRWQTYNIRDVDTHGYEVSLRRNLLKDGFVVAGYTGLTLQAPQVMQLSKYTLDYAPQSLTAAVSLPLPARFRVAPRLEYRRRTRSAGGEEYVLLDLRVGYRLAALVDVHVDGTNLLHRAYSEVAGVPMPGAAMTVSAAIGR